MYSDNSETDEDYQDEVFINTEHVSQTEELLADRRAVTLARDIEFSFIE